MSKLLLGILCVTSFSGFAKTEQADLYELYDLLKASGITRNQMSEKIQTCSEQGNGYCSAALGIYFFKKDNYLKAYPYLIQNEYVFKTINAELNGQLELALGYMLSNGLGIEKNTYKAVEHYKKCAPSGDSTCASNIATILVDNSRTNSNWNDYIESYAWRKVSRKLGNKYCHFENNTKQKISDAITTMQMIMGEERMLQGDKLFNKICATIPKCTQSTV